MGGDYTTLPTDTPIHRSEVQELNSSLLDKWLDGIRDRRLAAYRHFEEAEKIRLATEHEALKAMLTKQVHMIEKEKKTLERAIDKVETRAIKIRAIRMQLDETYDGR